MELDQFRDVDLVIDRANDSFVQKQFVSQGDYKGRSLTVQVTNNGSVGEVPGLTLNLRWHNEASGLTDLSAFSVIDASNSIFRIEYPQNMMTPGKVFASVQVIQNGKITNLKQFELTVQRLAGQAVGIVEKAEYSALVAILADANQFRTDIDSLSIEKADKAAVLADSNKFRTDIDALDSAKVSKGENESITAPMLSKSLLEDLKGGSIEVDVNTSMIYDEAVTYSKIAKKYNLSNELEWQYNKYISGESDGKILIEENGNREVVKVPINEKGTMEIQILDPTLGQAVFGTTSDGETKAFRQQFSELNSFKRVGYSYYQGVLTLDCELIHESLPDRYLYLTILKTNKDSFFVYVKRGVSLPEYYNVEEFNQTFSTLSDDLNETFKSKTIVYNTLLGGYNRDTGALYTLANTTMSYIKYMDIPRHGTLELTKPNLTQGQLFVIEDASGTCFQAYDYQHATGVKSVSFLTLQKDTIIVDFDVMLRLHPRAYTLYVSYPTTQLSSLVEIPRDNFLSSDVLPNLNFKDVEASNMLRYPNILGIIGEYYNVNLQNLFYQRQDNLMANANVLADNIEEKVTASKTIQISQNGTVMNELKILGKNNTLTSSTILGIGESTLNSKVYRKALYQWFLTRNITPNFVGSRGTGTAEDPKHDGWSGWTTDMFVNQATGALNYVNPFYNPSKSKFDYAYYKDQKQIPDPAVIVLSLGINDANVITNDQTIANLNFIIANIKTSLPNVKFVLSLPNTPNSFDPFFSQLHTTRMNIKRLVNALVENFSDKESSNIFISWGGFGIDPLYDMQHEERAVSVFNTKDKLVFGASRITEDSSNGDLHPSESGYAKKANLDGQAILYALN